METESYTINIWLDGYDDIFSDFDPRNFTEKTISDDFLHELKKLSRETNFDITELKLLLPADKRKHRDESMIIKRLNTHFKNSFYFHKKDKAMIRKKGIMFLLCGFIVMIAASYISFIKPESFMMHSLLILLEPAGWFSVWYGFENLFSTTRRETPELNFYRKIYKCRIVFENIWLSWMENWKLKMDNANNHWKIIVNC